VLTCRIQIIRLIALHYIACINKSQVSNALYMKKYFLFLIVLACNLQTLFSQDRSKDNRMEWWREARLGMFIHWGVYSVPAGTYNGQKINRIGEWIMNRGKIPVAEYQKFAQQFNPVKFDADAWVKMAKDAGMKYIVITAKHHDGFAMFKSNASNSLWKRYPEAIGGGMP